MGTIAIKFEFSRCLWKSGYKKKKAHQLQTRKQKKELKMHFTTSVKWQHYPRAQLNTCLK
jgi:hypothetical protein